MRKKYLILTVIGTFLLAVVSCGGGGDGDGDDDGQCADVSGTWAMTEVVDAADCGEGTYSENNTYTVTQSGCNITVVPGFDTSLSFSGSVNENQISWTGSWPEDGGTTTATINVTISGDSISGSASWTWTDGADTCQGTTQLTGSRIDDGEEAGTASTRFFNNLQCSGNDFTATLTVCGQTFTSVSGNWSSCDDITPGTCTVSLHAQSASCGTLSTSISQSFEEGSIYNFALTMEGENAALGVNIQSGDCSTATPWLTGVHELGVDLEKVEAVIDAMESNAGFQSID